MKMIKDIIAEMRKDMPRVVDAKVILRNYADRIEAAAKALEADRDNWRKQALAEDARANEVQSVGNAAKMREALLGIQKEVAEMVKIYNAPLETIASYVNYGLIARPRNCDLYATDGEAYQAYLTAMKNATEKTYVYFEPWLFEKVKGETK
jgi:hypothetical protein